MSEPDPAVLRAAADLQMELFEMFHRVPDLDDAINNYFQAFSGAAPGDPDWQPSLVGFSKGLWKHYKCSQGLGDLETAIKSLRRALDLIPPGQPDRHEIVSTLGDALQARFTRLPLADLDEAITLYREALGATEIDPADELGIKAALLRALLRRWERSDTPADHEAVADLDEAISLGRELLDSAGNAGQDRATTLINQGSALLERFALTAVPADLDDAIVVDREAVGATADKPRLHMQVVSRLAGSLGTRFEINRTPADLDEAITAGREALDVTPVGHPNRPSIFVNFGSALRRRFTPTGDAAALDEAITTGRQAREEISITTPQRPTILMNLGAALRIRFEQSGVRADIDEAITVDREALDAAEAGHDARPAILTDLGGALQARFQQAGSRADLDEAITVGRKALTASSPRDPDWPALVGNLVAGLLKRSARFKTPADLDEAINIGRDALTEIPTTDLGRSSIQANLGAALQLRFERTGTRAYLDDAITLCGEALDGVPPNNRNRPGRQANLGSALLRRFARYDDPADLDAAIANYRQAVDASPPQDPNRRRRLFNLVGALDSRFTLKEQDADLDEAIGICETVLAGTSADNANRPMMQVIFGTALRTRFAHTGNPVDLEEAITQGREALDSLPVDDPDLPAASYEFGLSLQQRFEHAGHKADLDEALDKFRAAATTPSAPADERALAAQQWGAAAVQAEDKNQAVEAFGTAVELMALVVPRSLQRIDQEYQLRGLADLASEAAAACLWADQRDRAVELFEQGRAVLFSQLLDTRSDLSDLEQKSKRPDLVAKFIHWRDVLDQLDSPPASGVDAATAARLAADGRRDAAAQFERVVGEIRALPDCEQFLRPRPVKDLLQAAAEGPVVLINCAALRSDALILTPSGAVELVELPDVSPDSAATQLDTFLEALDVLSKSRHAGPAAFADAGANADTKLSQVLGWLSDQITAPVLDRLGYNASDGPTGLPRVWWCPSGPLALLPIHAAGHHDQPADSSGAAAVIDRVISTTIPTVRALLQARHPETQTDPRVLVVAMPTTDGQDPLPGAQREAQTLRELLPDRVDALGLRDTDKAIFETVMTALPLHGWAHFACHALSDLKNPSASFLLLGDYHDRPLSVQDLSELKLPHAELAFLSACTTARTGATLPDEPIHLAAACQLAGYRHVIASLWPISDLDTVGLAKNFYTTITETTVNQAAAALHHATCDLRARHRQQPSIWAPYTHTGP
ncbi:CHAT domain-containing tetratricopeptide repeat protein [Mycobacterium sp. Marseille-P9652]|uniref:CHAT domain-containing tetratricopeptide repeat protein n=1 Tax=Mycobacterium sp. Marseille-P9652 TaxID=2654950 RepID=UPI0012E869B9|nr:CHAT domain-containing protein [Mycobacterium sp. Marseille-P9652]